MVQPREAITASQAELTLHNPLANCEAISGVVVHDVGQGDAISVLDEAGRCVLRIDYGGQQSSPFKAVAAAERADAIDRALPVAAGAQVMLTHWDEDHWSSARRGTQALSQGRWLVPRQWTSPRAVKRSALIKTVHCIPESLVGAVIKYEARNGDAVWWEKLQRFHPAAKDEDCNKTGVAFSVTSEMKNRVIFLPGDAPFDRVAHYRIHREEERRMRGLVAFHHGADTHWTRATRAFLQGWCDQSITQSVVFSCGDPNSHGHPREDGYGDYLDLLRTPSARKTGDAGVPILF